MLAWINTQIPEQKIHNFTSDWNDGIALCALVNRVKPGLIPNFATLSSSSKLENCTLGMKAAESNLDIPFLMDPEDLCHPEIDELSVMTYVSYFTKPANAHLLHYIQATIPDRKITNFTTDWNDGTNLACLLDALNSGGFPDCKSLDPHKALDNLTRGMKAAKDQLGIDPVLKPSQMSDPKVDELNIVTYLSRFQNAKPLPQPQAITCSGQGLSKAVVGTPATFQVDTSRGGVGDLNIAIDCNKKSIPADVKGKGVGIHNVQYQPVSGGHITIVVKWSGTEIPSSPYSFDVVDPSAFSLSSAKLNGRECAKVGEVVPMQVKGFNKVSDVDIRVKLSTGATEKANIEQTSQGTAKCSYIPRAAGVDEVVATITGIEIPGSPFKIKVIDPSVLLVTLTKPSLNEPLAINQEASFDVSARVGGVDDVIAEFMTPKGTQKVSLSSKSPSSLSGSVKPVISGRHEIKVTCGGTEIKGSPISLSVFDSSKCSFKDSLPKFLHVGKPVTVDVLREGAGEGTLKAATTELGILNAKLNQKPDDSYGITLDPKKVGEAQVNVTWNGKDIPKSPLTIFVCDASKCSAFGPGLTSGRGKTNEVFVFTVQVKGAGQGELCVMPKGPKTVYSADIKKASNETYTVSFTTFEVGAHSIDITWSGEPIPSSPFAVNFVKAAPATSFTVTGEGLKKAIAMAPATFMIMGPESGLTSNKMLKVSIRGMGSEGTVVQSKPEFVAGAGKPVLFVVDEGNGAYSVEYNMPKPGDYTISVTSNDENVPGSPFKVTVLPKPSAGDCTVFGHAIDNPHSLVLTKPVEFKVDSTKAGTGELSVTAVDKNLESVPAFLADDKSQRGKRIHAIKIDPTSQGLLKVNVKWSGEDIPKSPLNFEIGDPKAVIIIDLPDSSEYIGRKGEEISFSVDTRPAGNKGELKAAAKYSGGKVEPFRIHQNPDGTNKLLLTPRVEGKLEMILTYCGENILKDPWVCYISDPSAFKVTVPKGPTKKGDRFKFHISGVTAKKLKTIVATAQNNNHSVNIDLTFNQKNQAVANFVAEKIGEYEVVVKAAKKHVMGSPFKCVVVDPEACVMKAELPSILHVGTEKTFDIDVSNAGPGNLEFVCADMYGKESHAILSKISGEAIKSVELEGVTCGVFKCSLKFAGFLIPGMPKDITCTDPTKCTFTSDGINDGRCYTTSSITINADTREGGCISPDVFVSGPKSKYDIKLKTASVGQYDCVFSPWQEGSNKIDIQVGGKSLSGCPITFQCFKPLNATKVTVSGSGASDAVVNRRAQVTVHARDSKLIEQGILQVTFPDGGDLDYDVDIVDQLNGSYDISYVPKASGSFSFSITGEGQDIPGSPFNISVMPEPDPSKCLVKDRSGVEIFKNSPEICHLAKTPFEVGVYTSEAGSGTLTATGLSPVGSKLQLFSSEGTENGESVSYYKFDPVDLGVYSLNLCWDGMELVGSPFRINVVDPNKCVFKNAFPSYIRLGEDISLEIDTSSAGKGLIEACSHGTEVKTSTVEDTNGIFIVVLSGTKLGETTVDLNFGGHNISASSYPVSVIDPSKCILDFNFVPFNVNKPFTFKLDATGAGNAKIKVTSSKKCFFKVINLNQSTWNVSVTPKEIGEHHLNVFWGDWEVSGSPITIYVCDPDKIQVSNLPDPSEFLVIDVPVTFFMDHSEAGSGPITCQAKYSTGDEVTVEREETDSGEGKSAFTFIPEKPGKMTIILEYNNVSVLPRLYEYKVPDLSSFSIIPPTGYGKIKEDMKFGITGVKDESEIKISVKHPDHEAATVKMERSSDDSTVLARFTPKQTGDYTVEVTLADKHIDGSPFVAKVANPDAVEIIGKVEEVVHTGDEPNFKVDVSKAGPGELTFETTVISGTLNEQTPEDSTSWLATLKEGVGKLKVSAKWAGYDIKGSPFTFTFVDSQKVTWSCKPLDNDEVIKQGQLMNIILDCSAAGDGFPVVTARGPEGEYPTSVTDNEDGTFTVVLTPWQIGENAVEIAWGGKVIPKPIAFEVIKNIESRGISASGDGLAKAIANTKCSVTVNGIESGLLERGLLKAHFKGNEGKEGAEELPNVPSIEFTDEGDGVYLLHYTPTLPEPHTLAITYDGKDILNSPFVIPVLPAPDSALCKAMGEAIEKDSALFVTNNPVKFTVDVSEAGTGTLSTSGEQPNGESIRVYTVVEGGLHHLKFDPAIIGLHTLEVKWCDSDIPGSPFSFNVVDASKCLVTSVPGTVQANEPFSFTVDTRKAGNCTASYLSVTSEGAKIEPKSKEDAETPEAEKTSETAETPEAAEATNNADSVEGLFKYSCEYSTSGKAVLDIKIGETHVPGSPFNLTIVDSSQFSITGLNIDGDYAIVCEPVEINVSGQPSEDDEDEDLVVVAHGPTADLNVDVKQNGRGGYVAKFVPIEPGSYEVFAEFAMRHVRGSPFTIKVADPSKCQVLGKEPSVVHVGSSEEVTIKTRGAGEGKLEVAADYNDENLSVELKDIGLDTYVVIFTGKAVGEAAVNLQWAGYVIPVCPLSLSVCDASKCRAVGSIFNTKKGKAGSITSFILETQGAGEAKLDVSAKGPSAQYTMNVVEKEDNKYEVSFTPWEIGEHTINVLWGKMHVPESPFTVNIGSPLEMEVCNATGDGLKHAIAGRKATFTVLSSEVGLLDKNGLSVTVMGISAHAKTEIVDKNNGSYSVEYVPPSPGAYVATILFHGQNIPGSPFKVTVDPGPDASKCKTYGPALHPNALAIAGSPLEFFVDTAEAGHGELKVYIQGPKDYRPKVFMADDDQGVYSIKFDAMKPGKYFAVVVWSDQHIPKSPLKLRVHPAADASKVRAFGPGLIDAFIGAPGQFTIETKNAGIGTLLIRVHGLKDSFKIEAHPLSEDDPRTLITTYNPKLVGEYTIFVRWSGVHVPGSPFTVKVKQKPGEFTVLSSICQ